MTYHFVMVENHIEICNMKPLSLIKARIITHELLFKLFVKLNAGLCCHMDLCVR